jgi:PAS domain S-box-containing protein
MSAGTKTEIPPQDELVEAKKLIQEYEKSLEHWREVEAEWKKSHHLLTLITENVADLVAVLDPQANRLWNNRAYAEILGYTPEEMQGTYSLSQIHPEDEAMVRQTFQETIDTGVGRRIEYRMAHKDGAWIFLESEAKAVREPNGHVEHVVVVSRDISNRKKIEDELVKAKKNESVAMLAEGVAHDFNQVLAGMLGNIGMAKLLNKPDSETTKLLNEAERVAQKAKDTIARMMTISKTTGAPKQVFPLAPLMREIADRCVLRSVARAEFWFAGNLYPIYADQHAIQEVFENILRNSVESMQKPGIIRITGENIVLDKSNNKRGLPLPEGHYARIEVRDQGFGMTEKTLARVFEPYFTSKPNGTGLGLTTALSHISKHNGTILIDSVVNAGTSVSVYLPVDPYQKLDGEGQPKGVIKGRLLIMDDEPMILDFLTRMLEFLGYDVVGTKDGAEAIAVYNKARFKGDRFDAVMMDLIVPNGVGGIDAVETLKRKDPELKIIASSGFSNHPAMETPEKFGFSGVILKPYKKEDLQRVLQQVINSA